MPVMTLPLPPSWRDRWIFAALAAELAGDGNHATVDLPDLSLTVQNFRGRLAAFWNVCSHRSVQMRPAGRGRGALRCPYHGWMYDAAGVPVGIPDNALFYGLDAAARCALALRPAAMAACGNFLFLRGSDAGPDLAETLGPAFAALAVAETGRIAAARTARLPVPPDWPAPRPDAVRAEGLVLEHEGGWHLLRTLLPTGDGWDAGAVLLHTAPGTPPAWMQAALDALPAAAP